MRWEITVISNYVPGRFFVCVNTIKKTLFTRPEDTGGGVNGQVQGPGSLPRRKSLRCPLHTLLSGPHRQSGDAEEDRFLPLSGTKP